MVPALARVVLALLAAPAAAASARPRGREAGSLLQTWSAVLDAGGETPLAKVVGLLKSMQETLEKEMDEDQKLYEKLKCWCESNSWEKGNAVEASKEKVEQLKADIESLTAKEGGLTATIADVKAKTENDKKALADAIAIREKQKEEFHGMEVDSIQALENLKAAITVLAKHQGIDNSHPGQMEGASLPQLSVFSLLGTSARGKKGRWSADRNDQEMERNLDDFMRRNGFYEGRPEPLGQVAAHKFLQQGTDNTDATATTSWSAQDAAVVRKALKSAAVFAQAHHTSFYYPSYSAQSGEIVGILKQLQEEMQADLGEAQKAEAARSEAFEELRSAKTMEIEAGEKMEEQKEDELAKTANELAEAKEDLGQEQAILANNEAFLKNVKVTCADADKNWEERKAARQAEIVAVTETIGILTEDEAKDAAAGTYSLLQRGSARRAAAESSEVQHRRREAARALREVAAKTHSPELSMLANTVELDAFAKVKKAIDDMIVMLKRQTEDEVKKHDWCKAEFKENEMTTLKTDDRKADLEAKIAELASTIKALETDIAKATHDIEEAEVALQSASLARREENLDYQKVVADQTVVIDVLKKAAKRMAKYYESESLLQRNKGTEDPAPGSVAPVAQMEYKPSSGAAGVMQMLEKLILEAKELMAESKSSEGEAQKAYEETIASTNAQIADLQTLVTVKSKAKAKATKDRIQAEEDLTATVLELEGLAKYKADLHTECDFLLHNFDTRQESRGAEVEALQQAKQILNGAQLSGL
mmetsp:Transcript_105383/g.286179  ORF Transcript_105383/g.286179 Transcript_105383/m.286179 type:complete len:765 (-) Transcript_105383:162-2456(-)